MVGERLPAQSLEAPVRSTRNPTHEQTEMAMRTGRRPTGKSLHRGGLITETSAVAFRQNLGEMINQVQFRKDSIVITKDGKPVAALIDAQLFERIRRMQERFDALSARVAEGYANVPQEEGIAEIKRMAARVRVEMKAERTQAKAPTKRKNA